jgi:GntR family transcriptional regulator, transcriptional repressor for pyruvate dehydrogenase complex
MPTHLLNPIKAKRTFEEVSNRIKELIFEGVFKPNEKLPSENELAKTFKVGRQSVREALRLLEISGFISIQRGVNGGPIIQNTMLNKMAGLFLDTFKFNRIPIKDLTRARAEIEKTILRFVVDNATKTDLQNLRENVGRAKRQQEKNLPAFEENINFHRLLAKASKNHVFLMVIESILAVESDFRSRHKNIDMKKSIKITNYHEEILQTIESGDYKQGQELLETLIHEVHKMYNE